MFNGFPLLISIKDKLARQIDPDLGTAFRQIEDWANGSVPFARCYLHTTSGIIPASTFTKVLLDNSQFQGGIRLLNSTIIVPNNGIYSIVGHICLAVAGPTIPATCRAIVALKINGVITIQDEISSGGNSYPAPKVVDTVTLKAQSTIDLMAWGSIANLQIIGNDLFPTFYSYVTILQVG